MSFRSVSTAIMLTVMMFVVPFANVASADGTTQAPSSYAYLPSWNGAITGDLEQVGENYLGHTFSKHDFDEENNMYFVSSEDYGSWMNSQYSANGRGFHLLKITPDGSVEYTEKVSCTNYCNSPDYAYSKVVGVHAVAEDQLFVTFSVYNTQLSFGSNSQFFSGNNLITAFYNNGTWDWVDSESTLSRGYAELVYQDLDDNDNLYTVLKGPSTSGWSEYSISSASTAGTNWVRSLEVPYQSPQNNNLPPLFDVNETGLHIFATVKSTIKYDSQSTSCPLGGEEGFCHMWLQINTNGVKQSVGSSLYSSLYFKSMMVENGSMYLTGSTYDYVSGSNTESNFTGQKISHSPRYAQYLAVMNQNGGWDGYMVVNEQSESAYGLSSFIVDVMDDGSVIFSDWYYSQTSVDGEIINEYSDAALEYIISKIDVNTGIVWSANVGFDNANSLPTLSLSDGNTTAFLLTHPSNNGFAKYQYQGAEVSSPTGSNNSEILWVDLENGDIIDVEPTTATSVDGRSNDGGVIASQSNFMFYFMPDFDGDNIGSNDNCPNTFNPTQSDYNNNGDGDACDPDDDSDGVMDGFDSCPLGVLGWTSESITDHDGDGCKDSADEDLDDDNDGLPDSTDACPLGIGGASYDLDGDGCKDVEDDDDDGDLIRDESDLCSMGVIDWSSGTLTDHDADGCLDDDNEDSDDDNDGIADSVDSCPRGAVGWPSNLNTDFDNDGCRDGYEDEDDDGDGIPNSIDNCPQSIGIVNAQGCTATQSLDDENGGSSLVYYVCPVGSVVVLDPSDCPADNSNTNTSQSNNDSTVEDTAFYYVCPGGTDVVEDLSECSEIIGSGGTNVTLIVDPSSNESSDYSTCPDGRAIVLDLKDCPGGSNDAASSSSDSDSNDMMLFFMGGTFVMSTIAMIAIFVRRPQIQEADFSSKVHSTNYMFKEEPEIPALSPPQSAPPMSMANNKSSSTPSADLIGQAHNGKEWVEWPDNSGNHWYREVGFGGEWSKYDN